MGLEVLAVAAAVGTAGQLYSGINAQKMQKKQLGRQREAQSQALAEATSKRRQAEIDSARINQKEPDVSALLTESSKPVTPSSLLTSGSGLDFSKLKLGRPGSLLGE